MLSRQSHSSYKYRYSVFVICIILFVLLMFSLSNRQTECETVNISYTQNADNHVKHHETNNAISVIKSVTKSEFAKAAQTIYNIPVECSETYDYKKHLHTDPKHPYNIGKIMKQYNPNLMNQCDLELTPWRINDLLSQVYPNAHGGTNQCPEVREFMTRIALSVNKPTLYCESGMGQGHSAATMLTANTNISVLTFDWGDEGQQKMGQFFNSLFSNRFQLVRGRVEETIPKYITDNPKKKCDIIFIDAGYNTAWELFKKMAIPKKTLILYHWHLTGKSTADVKNNKFHIKGCMKVKCELAVGSKMKSDKDIMIRENCMGWYL